MDSVYKDVSKRSGDLLCCCYFYPQENPWSCRNPNQRKRTQDLRLGDETNSETSAAFINAFLIALEKACLLGLKIFKLLSIVFRLSAFYRYSCCKIPRFIYSLGASEPFGKKGGFLRRAFDDLIDRETTGAGWGN